MAGIRAFRIMFWPQAKFVYISRLFGLFCIILIVSQISLNRNNDFEQTDKELVNEDCLCNGENFCFKGLDSNGSLKLGRRFDCSLHEGLKVYKLLDSDAQQTPLHYMDKSWQPVFATAVSSNHIGECRTLVKRLRSVFPNSTIVLYDIGLTREQVREVASWCKVERKVVNFSSYPAHLKNLKTYAFKLVLIDMLQNYTAFFYYDSSVHIRGTNLTQFVSLVHNGTLMPFSTHTFASHNIISVTHPGMYDYLPINPNTGTLRMIQSSSMFVVDSQYTRRVMKWWYLCAMTKECIAPEGSTTKCNFTALRNSPDVHFDTCHRFDQSYWNIFHLTELFGKNQLAVRLRYAENLTNLDKKAITSIDKKQQWTLKSAYKDLVSVDRGVTADEKLEMRCN